MVLADQALRCPRCGTPLDRGVTNPLSETLPLPATTSGDLSGERTVTVPARGRDDLLGRHLHVYRCELLLGAGGMGRVYLAHHRVLHRKCALKILSPRATAGREDYVRRFQQEGRAAAALVHPHVVTVHAIGRAKGRHYLEMEFIGGQSLQQLIDSEGALAPWRATHLAQSIAQGLAAAHQAGLVHRDLKPDNVMLTADGIPKITDFGLAKPIASAAAGPETHLSGTPNYMAPELFAGQPATPASDVYALGASYFRMLTGKLPFAAHSLPVLMDMVAHDPLPPVEPFCPSLTADMSACLQAMLAKAPHDRPLDGTQAARWLQSVLGKARDLTALVQDAFAEDARVAWTGGGERYELSLTFPSSRRQTVCLETGASADGQPLLHVYSLCCRACPEFHESALRLNSRMAHGAVAVRDRDGQAWFVVVNSYPRGTVDAKEIRQCVHEVASRADEVERLLTGQDVH